MNSNIILITGVSLLMILATWIAICVCKKHDRLLAVYASLVTSSLQLIVFFIFRKAFVAEPFLFSIPLMYAQSFIIFQVRTIRGLQAHYPFLRDNHPLFSVALSALLYTVPWWFAAGWALKKLA